MNQTYISNLTHFLDEYGNIPSEMPKKAKEFAYFHAMIVDATTKAIAEYHKQITSSLRCHAKGCKGLIYSYLDNTENVIVWSCNLCGDNGRISHWQKTKWDNL